jgi:3-oxocholest-4-en-26-oyl-CoA dehydrogenase beta subunit
MDFDLTETQKEVAKLATSIFDGHAKAHPKHAAHTEATDDALWAQLAKAGLVGTAIAEDAGGAGHGWLEHCALMIAAGAAATRVPLWAVTTAALAIDRFGSAAQRGLLAAVARGEAIVVPALHQPDGADPWQPTAALRGGALHGVYTCVPAAARASHLVVSTADGLVLIDARGPGVRVEAQIVTSGVAHGQVTFDGAPAEPLGDRGARDWLLERAAVGLCAMELGAAEAVLRMTAAYTSQRVQFERPIATFQAVAQRAADAYIDVETIRVTLWEAAWRLAEGLPASREIAIAKIFAAEAGARVVYAAQHLHGGIGFDLDYPLARFYPFSKWLELQLGGASAHVARLGAQLAG